MKNLVSFALLGLGIIGCSSSGSRAPKTPQTTKESRLKSLASLVKGQSPNCGTKIDSDYNNIKVSWDNVIAKGFPTKEMAFEGLTFFLRYSNTPDQQTFLYRDYLMENYLLVSSRAFLQNHLWVLCPESPRYDSASALIKSYSRDFFSDSQKTRVSRRSFTWAKSPSLSSTALLLKLGLVVQLVRAEEATAPASIITNLEQTRKEILAYNEKFSRKLKSFRDSDKLPANFEAPEKDLRAYADLYFDDMAYTFKQEALLSKLYREVLLK